MLDAKEQEKISHLKPFLDKLIAEGIYIGEDLYNNALMLSGEIDQVEFKPFRKIEGRSKSTNRQSNKKYM